MLTPALLHELPRVVDEHGRQFGHGRNLGALKAELGQARHVGAFQALASLKLRKPDGDAARRRCSCREEAG